MRTESDTSKAIRTITLDYNGEVHTIDEWAKIAGIPPSTILDRVKKNWPVEKILTTPRYC